MKDVKDYTVRHDALTAEEFRSLWESVWGGAPSLEQTRLAMDNSLHRVSVYDGDTPIAMARMIGDRGLCCYIKDVVVRPAYQGQGLGRLLVETLLTFVRENGVPGTEVFVELCAMPNKMPFYAQFGFDTNEAQRMKRMVKVD